MRFVIWLSKFLIHSHDSHEHYSFITSTDSKCVGGQAESSKVIWADGWDADFVDVESFVYLHA